MILGLGQEIFKMSLEHPVGARKEGSSQEKKGKYAKRAQEPTERAPSSQSWNNLRKIIK